MGSIRYLMLSVLLGCGRISFDPLAEEVVIEPAFPSAGTMWNEYVLPDGSVCPYTTGFEDQFYDACLHAGEQLVVRLPSETSCSNLSVSDELGAFKWKCREEPTVTLYTLGLQPDTKLARLLEPDRWKPNRIFVRRDGELLYASQPSAWWSNPVVPLPDNSDTNVALLDQPNTIYTLAQNDWTVGYRVTAHGIGVVTLDDAVLSFSGTADNCGVFMNDSRCILVTEIAAQRLWFEGSFSGGAPARADHGLLLNEAHFSVVRHVRAYQFTDDAVFLAQCSSGLVDEVVATDNDVRGFHDLYGEYMIERDIVAANNAMGGIRIFDGGPWRLTNLRAINNGGDGVLFSFGALGVMSNVFAANNDGFGLRWTSVDALPALVNRVVAVNNMLGGVLIGSMYDNTLSNVVALNGIIGIDTTEAGADNRFAQLVSAHNSTYGLRSASFSRSIYSDLLWFGANSTQDCLETGTATSPGIDNSCNSSANVATGKDLTATFVGPTGRTAMGQLVTDWSEEPLIAWGRDGAPLSAAARGRCGPAETCREWDYRLSATDTVLRGAEPFVRNTTCPSSIDGNRVIRDYAGTCVYPSWKGSCARTYLTNAVELDDDHVGNDDGLCESNETCLYAPHLGLDHGSGDMIGPCIFVDGAVSNVTMYAREN